MEDKRQEAKGTGFFDCLCFSFHLQCGMEVVRSEEQLRKQNRGRKTKPNDDCSSESLVKTIDEHNESHQQYASTRGMILTGYRRREGKTSVPGRLCGCAGAESM